MKTTYWAMLLMLLPSMAYTQTTEKRMNLQCPSRSDLVQNIVMVL